MISLLDAYMQKISKDYKITTYETQHIQNDLRTNIKPFRPTGHLIHSNPLSLRDAFDSDKRSIKYFKDGINGYGNDYSIGKINDLTIKLGSLGIAGLIATSKSSPLQKTMEFLGLACWLGAMSLWPKLAINMPIKALKGIDLNAEYKTSAGHRKAFFQDPQFICWDMISDEDMTKLGDKLDIPTNIKNRRKATENKARQIAIQGNTLALLTAGFATPLVASLAADKLGKHVLTPLLEKYQEIRAENIAQSLPKTMFENLSDYELDASANKLIEQHVKSEMTPKDMNAIRKLFTKIIKSPSKKAITTSTLDDIFTMNDVDSYKIPVTSELKKKITELIVLDKPATGYTPAQLVNELLASCGNNLSDQNVKTFSNNLKEALRNKFISYTDIESIDKIIASIKKQLMDQRTITLVSPEATKEKLKEMAVMAQVYQQQYVNTFKNKYLQYAFENELSPHAHIWREINKTFLKIFEINPSELNKFLLFNDNTTESTRILYTAFDKITSDQNTYNTTMKKLSEFAMKMIEINDKFIKDKPTKTSKIPGALSYIDYLTNMFASSPYRAELNDFKTSIQNSLRTKRIDLLTKYIGTEVTLFGPIRTLHILKSARADLENVAEKAKINPNKLYEGIKNIMFKFQTTDVFVNKLHNLKRLISSDNDFKLVLDIIFSELPKDTEEFLPKVLVKRINDSTSLLKGLLLNLSDDVNFRFGPASESELLRTVKDLDLYKYINDLFYTGFKDEGAIIENIMKIAKTNPKKIDMIQHIFKFSESDLLEILKGNKKPLENNIYFKNALYKARDMFMLLDTNDLKAAGDISIGTTKMCQSSKALGKTINNIIKDAGLEHSNYKRWFTKTGLAFVALAGITIYGIFNIGKRNNYNPDKYTERSNK